MAREAKARLELKLSAEEFETDLGAGGGRSRLAHLVELVADLLNGTDDGEIDRVYSDELTVTTTPTDLDFVGGVTSKLNGQTVTLAEIVAVIVVNESAAGDVIVGGDANAIPIFGAATHTRPVKPGGADVWYAPAGVALVAGTGDILQLAASAGSVDCKVAVLGRSV